MKIPNNFKLTISTNSPRETKYLLTAVSKYLSGEISFGYQKSFYTGGRFSQDNKFKLKGYNNYGNRVELIFKKVKAPSKE